MKINKVKGYRNMLNLSQEEISSILGITKQSYYLKENGIREFKDNEKLKFKELLIPFFPEITLEEIFFN